MKKIKLFLFLLLGIGFVLSSCLEDNDDSEEQLKKAQDEFKRYLVNNNISENSKKNGIYFIRRDTIEGNKPEASDFVMINYTMRLMSSNRIVETNSKTIAKNASISSVVSTSGPFYWKVSEFPFSGIAVGLMMMNEGDSATFIIPTEMALLSQYTNLIPGYSNIIYDVRLVKIIKKPIEYDRQLINKKVTDSLQMNLSDTDKTGDYTGNYIKILDIGDTLVSVKEGSSVMLRYKGSYIDGRYFGDKNKYDTLNFVAGAGRLIPGFEDAVLAMNKKTKARVVIPYYNAYGVGGKIENGIIHIPFYTSLFYEIEIITVK